MYDCFTSSHSVYFEGEFDTDFHKQYKGVIVNARGEGGYGHFAIRKPVTFWFKLPKFIKRMFPYKWILYKNDREKMNLMHFDDYDHTITIFGDIMNKSYRSLSFDRDTYYDLKACIPAFLEKVGFKFKVSENGHTTTLMFE